MPHDTLPTDRVRWGIVAPGGIATSFATDLRHLPDHEVVAVVSRSPERAQAFATEFGGTAYATYDELFGADDVDVVYVASPHAFHYELASAALAAGKPVLCEKPLTLDRATGEQLVEAARAADRFLMEAMWAACNPTWQELGRRLRAGDFGTPRHLAADFHFAKPHDPTHRLFDPALGGGALLDIGIYPLTFAHLMLGEARDLRAVGNVNEQGVDLDVAIAGRYPGDTLATLTAGLTSQAPNGALITTDQGWLTVAGDFHQPDAYTFVPMVKRGQPGEATTFTPEPGRIGSGLANEAIEVGRCLREGLRESPYVPHAQTLTILGQMDDIRTQLGG